MPCSASLVHGTADGSSELLVIPQVNLRVLNDRLDAVDFFRRRPDAVAALRWPLLLLPATFSYRCLGYLTMRQCTLNLTMEGRPCSSRHAEQVCLPLPAPLTCPCLFIHPPAVSQVFAAQGEGRAQDSGPPAGAAGPARPAGLLGTAGVSTRCLPLAFAVPHRLGSARWSCSPFCLHSTACTCEFALHMC